MKGMIFDIKRFALHDGPGIRTTVFLKGCMLRCQWCCNPESQEPGPEILFIEKNCTRCGACEKVCPVGAHHTKGNTHTLNFSICSKCGQCTEVCMFDAVKMAGRLMDIDTVMEELLRDRNYYENSGGGISLSGGDPMFQFPFTLALLVRAREEGLHTCIETTGHTDAEKLKIIAPYVDLFLHDYKITDPALHKTYTGVDNKKILASLELLNNLKASVILRCPVIPGINDNDEHFRAIARISKQYENIQLVEIMPYHDFGKAKYKQTGRDYSITSEVPSTSIVESWIQTLRKMGCENVQTG